MIPDVPPTTPSSRPDNRPKKRMRFTPSKAENCFHTDVPRTPRSSRKRPLSAQGENRKRRLSHSTPTTPPSKRARIYQQDVEMTPAAPQETKQKAKRGKRLRTLKEIIRAKNLSDSVFSMPVYRAPPAPPTFSSTMQNVVNPPQTETSPCYATYEATESVAATHCSETYAPEPEQVYLRGDEPLEEIDISMTTGGGPEDADAEQEEKQNPMQARLMDDGRCLIRIARADGITDYYVLHPHEDH